MREFLKNRVLPFVCALSILISLCAVPVSASGGIGDVSGLDTNAVSDWTNYISNPIADFVSIISQRFGCSPSVDVFSQSYEDMDITLRRLAQNYFVVKKSLIPYCIVCTKIHRKVGIDDNTHQIIDKYYFGLPFISSKWVFSPPLWKLFNSYSRKEMPEKDWEVW